MSFGKWLSEKRMAANLTQPELAKRVGFSASYVSALERDEPNARDGSPRRPRVEKVDKLAKALGVPKDEARLAAGYAPLGQSGEVIKLPDVGQLAFLKDLPPDQARRYELAVKVAIAQAKAMMEAENET